MALGNKCNGIIATLYCRGSPAAAAGQRGHSAEFVPAIKTAQKEIFTEWLWSECAFP